MWTFKDRCSNREWPRLCRGLLLSRRMIVMEIYWGSGSPFAWRVLLALEVKKIPYTSRLIVFSKGQHKTPEFLALNPRGKVPTIRDGDFVLWESLAILAYLDRKVPEPPLFGRTPEDTGRVWKAISEVVSYLEPPGYQIAGPIFFDKAEENAEKIRAAIDPWHAELKLMEGTLSRSPWLTWGEAAVMTGDFAMNPPTAAEIARRERMNREG